MLSVDHREKQKKVTVTASSEVILTPMLKTSRAMAETAARTLQPSRLASWLVIVKLLCLREWLKVCMCGNGVDKPGGAHT